MHKKEKVEKKLVRSFFTVSSITAIAAIVGLIAIIVISNRYSYALKNFGFAEGDIGKAMFEFADIRSGLRAAIGYDNPDAIAAVVQQHAESKAAFLESMKEVEKTIVSEDGRATYDAIMSELDDYWKLDTQIIDLGATTDRELCKQAQDLALNELAGVYNSIYTQLESLLEVKVTEGNSLSRTLTILSIILSLVIVGTIVIAMLSSMKMGKVIAKQISGSLNKLGGRLETFSEGDLTSPFPEINTGDEVEDMGHHAVHMADNLSAIIFDMQELLGEMANGDYTVVTKIADLYTGDFHKMLSSMRGLRDQMTETLSSIGEASQQVQAGSGNLADASQNLAEGATEQAGAVQELQATISSIATTMEKTAESAEESYMKAQQYANAADNSREEMNTMMTAMERIDETSTRIGDIISEIESIAAQTNLLSLNASIEAARAGESGRGFAVVANQIRELADQSAKAAVDTRELIEGSLREVTEGNRAAERASEAILDVVDGIKQIAEFSRNLKVMVEDQTESIRQAEIGVNQISEVVQSNAATAEEASATSEQLSAQAITLDGLVGQFKLRKE
ncbi:methyl-accepting chemotaxis protein [bacterium C-53]|nr:methyl-accepting chemotaxis protein [Lachnospiraceae bacterium]NBI02981.1 methyl-accepting chemotaxis protein [Lachnospiraceae bacterium]RKJ10599.1 methyl-accepting chemotaxis protein [bacterium C-53]